MSQYQLNLFINVRLSSMTETPLNSVGFSQRDCLRFGRVSVGGQNPGLEQVQHLLPARHGGGGGGGGGRPDSDHDVTSLERSAESCLLSQIDSRQHVVSSCGREWSEDYHCVVWSQSGHTPQSDYCLLTG